MAFSIGIPFQDQINKLAKPNDDPNEEKKKKSFYDRFETIKDAKNKFEKAKKIVGYIKNPAVLYPVIAILAAILIAFLFGGGTAAGLGAIGEESSSTQTEPTNPVIKIPGLTLSLEGPNSVDNGTNLEYTIKVSYDQTVTTTPLSSIVVYEINPKNTTFVRADGAYTLENDSIYWPMSQNQNSFSFVLKPTTPDIEVKNAVFAKIEGPTGSSASTVDSCGGKYNLATNPIGANFGDPDCKFNKDDLYSLLKTIDPTNADGWYFSLVYCETGGTYNPNAYNGASTSGSAWGLFQMGHEAYPSFGITRQMNNNFDRGDVDWSTQSKNAVGYNQQRGNDFAYWGCKP